VDADGFHGGAVSGGVGKLRSRTEVGDDPVALGPTRQRGGEGMLIRLCGCLMGRMRACRPRWKGGEVRLMGRLGYGLKKEWAQNGPGRNEGFHLDFHLNKC
jgi:hypothetical protein